MAERGSTMADQRRCFRTTVPHREPRYYSSLAGAAREADRWAEHYGDEPMMEYGYRDQVGVWWRRPRTDLPDSDEWFIISVDEWRDELKRVNAGYARNEDSDAT